MSYKTELQSNNVDLQSILDMILALGLVDKPAAIVKFVIEHSEKGDLLFEVEEGMTWEEWVGSKYNTGGFRVNSHDEIADADEYAVYDAYGDGELVSPTDVIVSYRRYAC